MRTMANLVSEIVNMNSKDLEMLAQGIAWFSSGTSNKADQFRFFLETHIREYENMKTLKTPETL
jgi:hypothetical protein